MHNNTISSKTSSGSGSVSSGENKKQTVNKKKPHGKTKNGNDNTPGNLARTILHNLNIFGELVNLSGSINTLSSLGHKSTNNQQSQTSITNNHKDSLLDADSSSTKSGRRPSLDTVSTYLSQESRESRVTASTADLINCSASSDDGNDLQEMPSIVGM